MSTMDPVAKAAQEREERIAAQFAESEQAADAKASLSSDGRTNQSPDVVPRGSEADVKDEFTYDDSHWTESDKKKAAEKRIRAARDYGNLQFAQYLTQDDKLLGGKTRDKYEHEAVAIGVFCWKCGDAKLDDPPARRQRYAEKFVYAFPDYTMPIGLSHDDICLTCGAILGLRQEVA